jgi:hypothetical protein
MAERSRRLEAIAARAQREAFASRHGLIVAVGLGAVLWGLITALVVRAFG